MKRLFVIGNGFDRAHGLETCYSDFRNFLKTNDSKFFHKILEIYKYSFKREIHIITHEVLNTNDFDEEKYGYNLLWKDFEKCMKYVNESLIFDDYDFNLDNETEYDEQIKENIKRIVYEVFYNIYENLQDYFYEWISSININKLKKKTSLITNKNKDLYLTFNYTRVLEEVYDIKDGVCHIHGEVGKASLIIGHNNNKRINELEEELNYYTTRNKIILNQEKIDKGIEEFEEYVEEEETNKEFNERIKAEELLKFYKKTYKNTSFYIEKNNYFFNNISKVDEILVIGHSLNEIDMPYFRYIFSNTKNKVKWKIYSYPNKEEVKKELKKKILDLGVKEENIEILSSDEFWKEA